MWWLYSSTKVLLHWIPNIWSMEQESYLVSLMSKNTICFVSKNWTYKFYSRSIVLATMANKFPSFLYCFWYIYFSKYFKSYSRSFIESNSITILLIQFKPFVQFTNEDTIGYLISRYAFFTLIDLIFVKYFVNYIACSQNNKIWTSYYLHKTAPNSIQFNVIFTK